MDIREAKNRLEHLRRIGELERIRTEQRELEERYNPYHDPRKGRFTNANGGGMGGMLVVPKGGKGIYAQLNKGFSDEDIDDMYQAEMAKKPKALDKEKIKRANAQGSLFYEAGDAVERSYKGNLDEVDKLDLSEEEKAKAKDKLYDLASKELDERSKFIDTYTAGPARGTNTEKHLDKAVKLSAERRGYMEQLKAQSDKNKQKKKDQEAFNTLKKATEAGALEVEIDGKKYRRKTKRSNTWSEVRTYEYG